VVNAPPTNSLAAQKEALKKAAAAPPAAEVAKPQPPAAPEVKPAAAAAAEGEAEAPVPAVAAAAEAPAVVEPPKQTMAEYQKEQAAKRFVVEQKAVRRVDPTAYAKLQVLNADPAPAPKKPAEAPVKKPAAAPAVKAPAKGKPAAAAAAPKAVVLTAPKERKEKVLSLGAFVASVGETRGRGRGGRGGRYYDANAEQAAPDVEDASKFPSL
jgi:hypothetical protein